MNKIVYKDLYAFHPGYYLSEIIDDMGITQVEFATRLGTTPKTLSQLLNGQIDLSNEIADKLSIMLGTDIDVWIKLQVTYEKKRIEIETEKRIDSQIETAAKIDYNFFVKNAGLPPEKQVRNKVLNLCRYLKISDLNILNQPNFLVNFRIGNISQTKEINRINANAWIQTAMNQIDNSIPVYNAEKLKYSLSEIRQMTTQLPEVFLPELRKIFRDCGVSFVLLPYLKNSGINGAVKWFGKDRVLLAMNDRRNYADTFWFSLFHEIKHVLQQKVTMVFVSWDSSSEDKLETDADTFSQNLLIPQAGYSQFISNSKINEQSIRHFAREIGIHSGIVVGRLQHDRIIEINKFNYLKTRYQIIA